MLAAVGGLLPEAGRRITITRRSEYGPIPLPNAIQDAEGRSSTVEISLESLTQNINPEQDIVLQAYDIVSVELAESVYVSGEVVTPGPIELTGRGHYLSLTGVDKGGWFYTQRETQPSRGITTRLGDESASIV